MDWERQYREFVRYLNNLDIHQVFQREREKVRERESTMNIRDEYVSQLHQLNDSDFKNISSNYVFSNV